MKKYSVSFSSNGTSLQEGSFKSITATDRTDILLPNSYRDVTLSCSWKAAAVLLPSCAGRSPHYPPRLTSTVQWLDLKILVMLLYKMEIERLSREQFCLHCHVGLVHSSIQQSPAGVQCHWHSAVSLHHCPLHWFIGTCGRSAAPEQSAVTTLHVGPR